MSLSEICEATMLVFFSLSWFWSIGRMLRSGQAAGRSAAFVTIICACYLIGIAGKMAVGPQTAAAGVVVRLNAWTFVVTAVDLVLVVHFTRRAAAGRARAPAPARVTSNPAEAIRRAREPRGEPVGRTVATPHAPLLRPNVPEGHGAPTPAVAPLAAHAQAGATGAPGAPPERDGPRCL